MDLFSINFIHFGAPKFWYSVPQGRAAALEQTMRGISKILSHDSFQAHMTLGRLLSKGYFAMSPIPQAQIISCFTDSARPIIMSA
jgi:hypothetical protein